MPFLIKAVAIIEIISGIMGSLGIFALPFVLRQGLGAVILTIFLFVLPALSIFAGYQLLKGKRSGYFFSLALQLLQVVAISSPIISFSISFGLSIPINFGLTPRAVS